MYNLNQHSYNSIHRIAILIGRDVKIIEYILFDRRCRFVYGKRVDRKTKTNKKILDLEQQIAY